MILWLYAFLLQSTFFLGAAWLIVKLAPQMRLRLRETVWSIALLASVLGPTAHAFWPTTWPTLWHLPVPTALLSEVATAPTLPPEILGASDDAVSLLQAAESTSAASRYSLPVAKGTLAAIPSSVASSNPTGRLQTTVAWLWILGSALALCLYGVRLFRFRALIRKRQPIMDPKVRLALDRLRIAANLPRPIKLTQAACLGSPIAFGIGRQAEICLPERACRELPIEQIQAMLGHEIAHHMRKDPIRLLALNLLEAAFFFQPILRIAHADLQQTAEEHCDAWGAQQNGDRWSMARCLAEVATWLLPEDRSRVAVGMARKKSKLSLRVRHLMDDSPERMSLAGLKRRQIGGAVLALIAAPLLAPQVAFASVESDETSSAPTLTRVEESASAPAAESSVAPLSPILELFDYQAGLVSQELQLFRQDLGPFAEIEPYRSQLAGLDRRLGKFNELRQMLVQLLTLIQLEEGPSSDTTQHN